jgi:hypothetical protein
LKSGNPIHGLPLFHIAVRDYFKKSAKKCNFYFLLSNIFCIFAGAKVGGCPKSDKE